MKTGNNFIGYYPMGPFCSLEVWDIEHGIDDKVVFRWVTDGCKSSRLTKSKIRYDEQGEPFFKTRGMSVSFNDVMRWSIPFN